MELDTIPASKYSLPDLVKLLNRGFEDYFIPIQFTSEMFSSMLRKDGIELDDSRVLIADDESCGIALVACRHSLRASRLAAMGIAKERRGRGAGSWFMDRLIGDARQRGEREMVLEVIEQNEAAVRLYRSCGFESVRRLLGFMRKDTEPGRKTSLYKIDLTEMACLLAEHGFADLPWQLSGESLTHMTPPPHAYRRGQAYVVASNPGVEHVVIWSVLVEKEARGSGLSIDLLKNLIANYPGKTWHVPAIFPEELAKVFERAGFERETLSQWQMKLTL